MKYKLLTKEQIIISLDRLTRFKNTKEKYLRVFIDVLITSLLEPKLKRAELECLDCSLLSKYVSEIFNSSLKAIKQNSIDSKNISSFMRDFLCNYENNIFINDDDTQKLLNNNIDYYNAFSLIDEDSPINLKWFSTIANFFVINKSSLDFQEPDAHNFIVSLRENNLLKFPIEKVILVEGITEEILLPVFSKFLGLDFYAKGLQIIAAGGKNQVVKKYYELSQELKIPIFVLLDKDAEENIIQIKPKLRENDRIHLVSCGEFEDLLPKSLIIKTVNEHFKNFLKITEDDLLSDLPTAKVLDELFKTKGLHEFKKAEFAKLVKEKISSLEDVSDEIKTVIEEIFD